MNSTGWALINARLVYLHVSVRELKHSVLTHVPTHAGKPIERFSVYYGPPCIWPVSKKGIKWYNQCNKAKYLTVAGCKISGYIMLKFNNVEPILSLSLTMWGCVAEMTIKGFKI